MIPRGVAARRRCRRRCWAVCEPWPLQSRATELKRRERLRRRGAAGAFVVVLGADQLLVAVDASNASAGVHLPFQRGNFS